MRVLDAGCGGGAVTVRAARAVLPGGHITGIGSSAEMLARADALARCRHVSPAVTLTRADPSSPPYQQGSFHAVLASLLLDLLPEPSAALASWHGLLTGGGTLAFSWDTGQTEPRWAQVDAVVDAFALGQPGTFSRRGRLPQPAGMSATLRHYGYEVIAITAERATVRYANPEQWWHASVSDGPWQHIPRDLMPAARARALRMTGPLREPDGGLTRSVPVAYAVTRTPC
jgi:SAM-dependent methyltransferase